MKINNLTITITAWLCIIAWNCLFFFDFNLPFLRVILSLLFILYLPGYYLLSLINNNSHEFWENLLYRIGLSIGISLFVGLLANTLLGFFHITNPLESRYLVIGYDLVIIPLLLYNGLSKNSNEINIAVKRVWLIDLAIIAGTLLLLLLSISGTILLNNGGGNLLIIGSICIITGLFIFISAKHKVIESNTIPLIIFAVSLALLFSYSMRSQYVVGWDVNKELKYFLSTNDNKRWDISPVKDPFEACLSITILPTIITSLTEIDPQIVFKVLYQIIFSLVPVILYIIYKNLFDKYHAHVAAFLLMFQIWFIQQMPALARQEIAMLFFLLILMTLFSKKTKGNQKDLLITIFSLSLVVTHYSTAYVWALMIILSYIFSYILRILKISNTNFKLILKPYIVIVFFIAIFVWNFLITKTSNTATQFTRHFISSFREAFTQDLLVNNFERMLYKYEEVNTQENIDKYSKETIQRYHNSSSQEGVFYDISSYKTYKPIPLSATKIASLFNNKYLKILASIFPYLIKVLVINIFITIGIFVLIKRTRSTSVNANNFALYCLCCLPLVLLSVVLPVLRISYNTERLFLQSLVFLAYPTIIGGITIFNIITRLGKVIFTLVLFIFFIFTSGIYNQIFGGAAFETLNNFGEGYDKYYVTTSEINSAKWLDKNHTNNYIYSDELANLRLIGYTHFEKFYIDILPGAIFKPAYVYVSNTNISQRKAMKLVKGGLISYTYPFEFLESNKNIIYSNGKSEIYK